MAAFATFLTHENMSMGIKLNLDGDEIFSSETITNENSNVLITKSIDLEDNIKQGIVQLSGVGLGSVFTQVVQYYHVRDTSQDPFNVEFSMANIVKRDTDAEPDNKICIDFNAKATDVMENR